MAHARQQMSTAQPREPGCSRTMCRTTLKLRICRAQLRVPHVTLLCVSTGYYFILRCHCYLLHLFVRRKTCMTTCTQNALP